MKEVFRKRKGAVPGKIIPDGWSLDGGGKLSSYAHRRAPPIQASLSTLRTLIPQGARTVEILFVEVGDKGPQCCPKARCRGCPEVRELSGGVAEVDVPGGGVGLGCPISKRRAHLMRALWLTVRIFGRTPLLVGAPCCCPISTTLVTRNVCRHPRSPTVAPALTRPEVCQPEIYRRPVTHTLCRHPKSPTLVALALTRPKARQPEIFPAVR